jgi:hypothetical protein
MYHKATADNKERKYRVYVIRGSGRADDVSGEFRIVLLPAHYRRSPVNLQPLAFRCQRPFRSQADAKLEAEWLFGPLEWKPTASGNQICARVILSAKS